MKTEMQAAAIAKLSRLKVGALFMEMGTGKTRVALELMASKQHKVKQFLWICPLSLKGEIENERLKWVPELSLKIVGVETISASQKTFFEILESVKKIPTFCVVDESLKIKNIAAKRTKRILQIGGYCHYRMILNGTPVSRNILDLWSQIEFLSPKILDINYRDFKYTYCEFKKEPGRREHVIRHHNIPHLISKIEPYIFDAKLYLDIPKHYETAYYCIDLRAYNEKKEELWQDALLSCGDTEIGWYKVISNLQRYYTSQSAHYECIQRLVDKIQEPVVVFVKYISTIPDGALALTGDVAADDRQTIIARHKAGEQQALYVTYGLGAYGLNLQYCQNVIFAEHSWDYAQRIQAEARIYRLGQSQDCYFYDIDCNTGLERILHECNSKKENLADRVKRAITEQKAKQFKELL